MRVKIENLCFTFDKKTVMEKEALHNVSLGINGGEFVAVVGKSGCGKTSLLSIIAGLEKPCSGTVQVDCSASMMYQNPEKQLFAQTVAGDVMYGPLNMGKTQEEAYYAATGALELVGIDSELFKKNPLKLSGGQMRRVALAGIIAMKRPLLLLDEPTVGLDRAGSDAVMNAIKQLNKSGTTVVMATQDCELAAKFADRIVVMNDGNISCDFKSDEVIANCENLTAAGVTVPDIFKISALLFKQGVIKQNNLTDARSIFEQIGRKNDSNK